MSWRKHAFDSEQALAKVLWPKLKRIVAFGAGLYRYVTDHIVCIQETQLDKILFTIY